MQPIPSKSGPYVDPLKDQTELRRQAPGARHDLSRLEREEIIEMLEQATIRSHAPRPFPFAVAEKTARDHETDTLWSAGTRQSVAANRAIYSEGDRADRIFKVVSGAVRTFQLLEDGRRQVNAFYLAGEMFGLEAGETY